MFSWVALIIAFASGIFVTYIYSRLRRMFRKFTQCGVTIEKSLNMWGNSESIWYWCAGIRVTIPKIRGIFADPMPDMLFGEVIIDKEGKGRSGGYRNTRWIGVQTTDLLEIPKVRGGKLLLLSESIDDMKVYLLDHMYDGAQLELCKYILYVRITRDSDKKIVAQEDFEVEISHVGLELCDVD